MQTQISGLQACMGLLKKLGRRRSGFPQNTDEHKML
jgi:hypothetical protein